MFCGEIGNVGARQEINTLFALFVLFGFRRYLFQQYEKLGLLIIPFNLSNSKTH